MLVSRALSRGISSYLQSVPIRRAGGRPRWSPAAVDQVCRNTPGSGGVGKVSQHLLSSEKTLQGLSLALVPCKGKELGCNCLLSLSQAGA